MRLDIYIHIVNDDATQHSILEKVTQMAVDMTKLVAAVAAEKTVLDSAIAFINGVPALVAATVKQALLDEGVADAAAQAAADQAQADIEAETASVQAALTATPTPPVTPTP